MKTIVIANQKGGSGKSTLTVHLAAVAEAAGDGPALITDTDPQGTALVKGLPLIRQSGTPFSFILTRVRPNVRNNDGAAMALDALGLVLPTRMHERVIYAETFAHGKTAIDIEPKGVAATELRALWIAVKERIDEKEKVVKYERENT